MISRIIALFVGLLTLVNLAGDVLWPGFDASIWWISFGHLPRWCARLLLAVSAITLLMFAFRSPSRSRRSVFTACVAGGLACVALVNAVGFYALLTSGRIAASFPVPLSLLVALGMILVANSAWTAEPDQRRLPLARMVAGSIVLFAAFPLALMLYFGNTDYRRSADVAVVFGARTYADGRMSDALKDRIRAGCELYRAGLVKRLLVSGGPGDGLITEAAAMREYALSHGVADADIIVDDQGLNTDATVRTVTSLVRRGEVHRVLVVSHFYHLPRIKLACERAGIEVCTVPARQAYVLRQIPYSMAREVAAFWTYYLRQKPAGIGAA